MPSPRKVSWRVSGSAVVLAPWKNADAGSTSEKRITRNTNSTMPSISGTSRAIRRSRIRATATMRLDPLGLEQVDAGIRLCPYAGELLRVPGGHQLVVDHRVEDGLFGDDVDVV